MAYGWLLLLSVVALRADGPIRCRRAERPAGLFKRYKPLTGVNPAVYTPGMDKIFTHRAKICVGCQSFEFEGSREYVEQQIERMLALVGKMCCPADPAVKPDGNKRSSGKRPAAKAAKA